MADQITRLAGLCSGLEKESLTIILFIEGVSNSWKNGTAPAPQGSAYEKDLKNINNDQKNVPEFCGTQNEMMYSKKSNKRIRNVVVFLLQFHLALL